MSEVTAADVKKSNPRWSDEKCQRHADIENAAALFMRLVAGTEHEAVMDSIMENARTVAMLPATAPTNSQS